MVRGPKCGNGTRSSEYYLYPAGLVPPRPRAQAMHSELDPLRFGARGVSVTGLAAR
jgi:hypothetical protein